MPKIISFDDEYYHGTVMNKTDLITQLNIGDDLFQAIWFTTDEYIAEKYADNKFDDEINQYKVILLLTVKANNIASFTYEEVVELLEKLKLEDFRETITFLKKKKYKGWQVPGSIDLDLYNDMCVFYENLIKVKGISFFINDDWTPYFDLQKAKKFIENSNKVNY